MDKKVNSPLIIPTMRYENAKLAIEWLCRTLGFEKRLVIEGDNDTVVHAQLVLGNAMIMLGSLVDDDYGKFIQTPNNLNGVNTGAPYLVVENIDEHYNRAVSEGAKIVMDIKDEDYGGRGYSCIDLEGHLWNFGSYNPWTD